MFNNCNKPLIVETVVRLNVTALIVKADWQRMFKLRNAVVIASCLDKTRHPFARSGMFFVVGQTRPWIKFFDAVCWISCHNRSLAALSIAAVSKPAASFSSAFNDSP